MLGAGLQPGRLRLPGIAATIRRRTGAAICCLSLFHSAAALPRAPLSSVRHSLPGKHRREA